MSKNLNRKPSRQDAPLNGAMKFFLAGCVAELYLLIVRRFYIAGTLEQVVAWDTYLMDLLFVGLALLVLGLVAGIFWRKKGKLCLISWSVFGVGAFLAVSSWLLRSYYTAAMSLLCVTLPALMLLSILWSLYDRECTWALIILGTAVAVLWVCRKGVGTQMWNMQVRAGALVYLVALAGVALLTWQVSKKGGRLGKFSLLPGNADTLPIYVACGLSAGSVAGALFSATIAYYAMWALALVIFALAVYYTVKQL